MLEVCVTTSPLRLERSVMLSVLIQFKWSLPYIKIKDTSFLAADNV